MKEFATMLLGLVFVVVGASVSGCGGGSGSDASRSGQSSSGSAPATAEGAQAWPGRAWFVRNTSQLYSRHYADANATLVDNDLSPAENTNAPAVAVSKNGAYYVTRASNHDVTESHFSIRRAVDAMEVKYFWSTRHSGIHAISNDGRYLAWVSSTTFSDFLNGIYDLRLLDTQANGGREIKAIHAWNYGSAADGIKVLGFDWTWDNRLLLFLSTGHIYAHSPATDQSAELGRLPEKFEGKTIHVGTAVVNRDVTQLAGMMLVSSGNTEVWVSNIDGSNIHQNTAVGTVITTVDWAPVGELLHGGDCRGVLYGSAPQIDTGGRYSWMISSDTANLSLQDSKKFTATFKEEVYPNYLDCDFFWTE